MDTIFGTDGRTDESHFFTPTPTSDESKLKLNTCK